MLRHWRIPSLELHLQGPDIDFLAEEAPLSAAENILQLGVKDPQISHKYSDFSANP